MDSESTNDTTFKEYRDLEPMSRSLEQYLVLFFHLAAALIVSAIQFRDGLSAWILGFGVVTPILLIIHGYAYSTVPNDSWHREQMVPFMLSIVTATEIETDRYLQCNRRCARFVLILGWPVILLCQIAWTLGLTKVVPVLMGDNLLIRILGELAAWLAIFGPFFLYFLIIMPILVGLSRLLESRYRDIKHLLDIDKKWNMENRRRAKDPEFVKKQDATADRQWF